MGPCTKPEGPAGGWWRHWSSGVRAPAAPAAAGPAGGRDAAKPLPPADGPPQWRRRARPSEPPPRSPAGPAGSRAVSDARLVAVEGRDVEHVAVRAHADRLHLPVARQRRRVRGAARAEDLPAAAAVVLPADDCERRFAGGAEAAGLVRDPLGRVCGKDSGDRSARRGSGAGGGSEGRWAGAGVGGWWCAGASGPREAPYWLGFRTAGQARGSDPSGSSLHVAPRLRARSTQATLSQASPVWQGSWANTGADR